MIQVKLLPEASEEFVASAAFYESIQRGLGQSFIDEVEKTLNRIAEHPKAARIVVGNFRQRLVHRFPFAVVYQLRGDQAIVAAIAHRRRRPGYWQSRT